MKEVEVRNAKQPALVSDEDYGLVCYITWRISKSNNPRRGGYAVSDRRLGGKVIKLLMHRIVTAAPAGMVVDHKDGNKLNNQRCNLRVCTNAQNVAYQRGHYDRISKYKGVSWDKEKGKWKAQIHSRRIGRFNTEVEAALAYDEAARAEFGEYAFTNF